jgi:asparagine synthase (glutamine-hydrolysing)
MMKAMLRRGPDGQAVTDGEGFMLAHGLLDTAGNGPAMGHLYQNEDIVLTADCRLDNREELIRLLGSPAEMSDTGLLAESYRRWGDDMAARLLGDFAFALWDKPRRRLLAARDHFGVKPFYFCFAGDRFLFASDIGVLLVSGEVNQEVREAAIADFLAMLPPPPDLTAFAHIGRLPPAHIGVFEGGAFRCEAYWKLPVPCPRARPNAAAEFRGHLEAAVQARLRGGKLGAMLSGGLDSSSIAALAARHVPAFLPVFSLVFGDTPGCDERPFIEAVLGQGSFSPHFIPSGDVAPFGALDEILQVQQDLFLAPNIAVGRRLYAAARAQGAKILLDGHGGDEVAPAGFVRLAQLARQGEWWKLMRALPGPWPQKARRFVGFLRHHRVLGLGFRIVPGIRRRLIRPRQSRDLWDAGLGARTGLAARQAVFHAGRQAARYDPSMSHYETINSPLQSHAFEILDRLAADAGVEPRYPFWDKRLVEFSLSLPPEEFCDGGWGRLVLRRAMEGVLPDAVRWRRDKFDFTQKIAAGMVAHDAELIDAVLRDATLAGVADTGLLRAGFARIRRAPLQAKGRDVHQVWQGVVLGGWLRARRRG